VVHFLASVAGTVQNQSYRRTQGNAADDSDILAFNRKSC